jgi:eukaryotic-like serine/threonine-protein kinase
MASQAPDQDFLVGSTLGHYRIVEKIGAGGMGEVYRASDEHLDRNVAIKVLPPKTFSDDSARKHFRKEALALSKLNHPNIATIHDFDTQQGIDFLVMEYVPGVTLSERIANHALPEREFTGLGLQLVEGLAAAHEQGVIHRDLKPNNLRLTPDGRLKILDFGLAKLAQPATPEAETDSETRTGAGTLPYMSPEQLQGETVDGRSDIWAAGTVLYEMATGQTAFHKKTAMATADAILHKPVAPPGRLAHEVSPQVEGIILKCLEKEAENRYQSAKELAVDLRRLSAPSARASVRAPEPKPWRTLVRAAIAVLTTLFTVAALLVAFKTGDWRDRLLGRAGQPQISSLAVLPLANLSRDPEQEYFASGMTDELITNLGKISALRVISRSSVMQYEGHPKPVPQIAKELNVDAVVEGSVLRSGNRVRISAQLVQANPEKNLWTESYERDLSDVLALQREVAQAIAEEVQIELSPQETSRLQAARAVKPDAYEAYLKGRYFWNKRDREGVAKGLQYFEQAVKLEPNYGLAYAGMADSYMILVGNYWVSPREAFPKAKAMALKAVEIDDSISEAHTSLAQTMELEWDWNGAEREYKRALALNPGYATAHQWFSFFLSRMARHERAIMEAKRAAELDPLSPVMSLRLAQAFYLARRYEEAKQALQKTLEVSPDFFFARHLLGVVDLQDHKLEESIAELQTLSPGDDETKAVLAYAYALSGRKREAKTILDALKEQSERRYVSPRLIALVCVGLNKNGEAFERLEEGYKQRDSDIPSIGVEPMFDPLRSDPRFHDLLRRMNVPD